MAGDHPPGLTSNEAKVRSTFDGLDNRARARVRARWRRIEKEPRIVCAKIEGTEQVAYFRQHRDGRLEPLEAAELATMFADDPRRAIVGDDLNP